MVQWNKQLIFQHNLFSIGRSFPLLPSPGVGTFWLHHLALCKLKFVSYQTQKFQNQVTGVF